MKTYQLIWKLFKLNKNLQAEIDWGTLDKLVPKSPPPNFDHLEKIFNGDYRIFLARVDECIARFREGYADSHLPQLDFDGNIAKKREQKAKEEKELEENNRRRELEEYHAMKQDQYKRAYENSLLPKKSPAKKKKVLTRRAAKRKKNG